MRIWGIKDVQYHTKELTQATINSVIPIVKPGGRYRYHRRAHASQAQLSREKYGNPNSQPIETGYPPEDSCKMQKRLMKRGEVECEE